LALSPDIPGIEPPGIEADGAAAGNAAAGAAVDDVDVDADAAGAKWVLTLTMAAFFAMLE